MKKLLSAYRLAKWFYDNANCDNIDMSGETTLIYQKKGTTLITIFCNRREEEILKILEHATAEVRERRDRFNELKDILNQEE